MTSQHLISGGLSDLALNPYVSDHALSALGSTLTADGVAIEGTLAFFDVSGFTKLTERLARAGQAPSTSTTCSTRSSRG